MARSSVLAVLAFAACATGRAVPPATPAVEPTSAPPPTAAPPLTTSPSSERPPDVVEDEPDPAAIAAALEHATLTVHAARAYAGAWPAELEVERAPSVFLVELDLELASYAYAIDPDKLLLESTRGDIVSQAPLALAANGGRVTALFVLAKAMRSKRLVLSYEGKRSAPFAL